MAAPSDDAGVGNGCMRGGGALHPGQRAGGEATGARAGDDGRQVRLSGNGTPEGRQRQWRPRQGAPGTPLSSSGAGGDQQARRSAGGRIRDGGGRTWNSSDDGRRRQAAQAQQQGTPSASLLGHRWLGRASPATDRRQPGGGSGGGGWSRNGEKTSGDREGRWADREGRCDGNGRDAGARPHGNAGGRQANGWTPRQGNNGWTPRQSNNGWTTRQSDVGKRRDKNAQDRREGGRAGSASANRGSAQRRKPAAAAPTAPREITLPAGVTVRQLAGLLGMDVPALEDALAAVGARPTSDEDAVSPDEAELVALEHGLLATCDRPAEADAVPRPAVVAVLGHVDHGKTTLLDALRDTAVATGEAGGITQHIGAFEVTLPSSQASITFLDTPGHASFSAMRQRGAQLTDIAVLVVDARDGVKPQTREALRHAKAARCPLVVALTKCDLPDADTGRVRQQLLAEGVELEEAGGSVQVVEVAAKAGRGLVELEEALMLQAEIMDLKAGLAAPPEAVVVEARMDKGRGPVATVIVQTGTLTPGSPVIVGQQWGKVRSLTNPGGRAVDAVLPGHAAEVTGLRGVPQAGDRLAVLPSEDRARRLSAARAQRADEDRQADGAQAVAAAAAEAASAADAAGDGDTPAQPTRGRVLLLVKADTQGSCEAVWHAVEGLSGSGVDVSVVAASVGPVTLSDVEHASATGARVLAFNVRTGGPAVDKEAKRLGVAMTAQRVIYHLMDDVAGWAAGAVPRVAREVVAGRADVLQVFRAGGGASAVAGVRVTEGALAMGETFRVLRGGETVFEGSVSSLRRHKLAVDRVGRGTECGVLLDGFQEFQQGDVLLCVATEYVAVGADEEAGKGGGGGGGMRAAA